MPEMDLYIGVTLEKLSALARRIARSPSTPLSAEEVIVIGDSLRCDVSLPDGVEKWLDGATPEMVGAVVTTFRDSAAATLTKLERDKDLQAAVQSRDIAASGELGLDYLEPSQWPAGYLDSWNAWTEQCSRIEQRLSLLSSSAECAVLLGMRRVMVEHADDHWIDRIDTLEVVGPPVAIAASGSPSSVLLHSQSEFDLSYAPHTQMFLLDVNVRIDPSNPPTLRIDGLGDFRFEPVPDSPLSFELHLERRLTVLGSTLLFGWNEEEIVVPLDGRDHP